jgi:glycosyltransferase involved in cell wall biosynthesis
MPDRIGGMDAFFWAFDAATKEQGYLVDWYFPNTANHGDYPKLTIHASGSEAVELFFLEQVKQKHMHYDVIMCHFVELCTPFYKHVKQQLPQSKVIAVDHNPRPLGGYPLKKRLAKRMKGWLYARYIDTIIGVSAYTVKEIVRDFGSSVASKTLIVHNGVLTDHIQRRNHRNRLHPNFLTACHLRYSKGIQDLIEAVSLIPEAVQSAIHIDVYGDGDYKKYLQKLVNTKHLTHQFSFKGNSPDLGSVYHHYDYLLHPSHMECFSLGILESLAANVPVITTTVGGNAEVITSEQNGYLFTPRNVHQLKELIENVYTGKKTIQMDTDVLIKQQFTLSNMVTQYLNLLS